MILKNTKNFASFYNTWNNVLWDFISKRVPQKKLKTVYLAIWKEFVNKVFISKNPLKSKKSQLYTLWKTAFNNLPSNHKITLPAADKLEKSNQTLVKLLQNSPTLCTDIFELENLQVFNDKEIANICNVPAGTINVLKLRFLRNLRETG